LPKFSRVSSVVEGAAQAKKADPKGKQPLHPTRGRMGIVDKKKRTSKLKFGEDEAELIYRALLSHAEDEGDDAAAGDEEDDSSDDNFEVEEDDSDDDDAENGEGKPEEEEEEAEEETSSDETEDFVVEQAASSSDDEAQPVEDDDDDEEEDGEKIFLDYFINRRFLRGESN
jgi:hypothetical protein